MAEDLADLADALRGIGEIVGESGGDISEEVKAQVEDSLKSYEYKGGAFKGGFSISSSGKDLLAEDSSGRQWSVSQALDSWKDGDIEESFKEMLGDEEVGKPDIAKQVDELQKAEDNTPKGQDKIAQKTFADTGAENAKKLPKTSELFKDGKTPTKDQLFKALESDGVDTKGIRNMAEDVEDLQKKIKSGELKTVDDVEEELKKKMDANPSSKSYFDRLVKVLGIAMVAAAIFLAVEFVEFLKQVRDAMNGCWSSTQEGKCKIDVLTCNKDDMNGGSNVIFGDGGKGFQVCYPATDSTGKHTKTGSNMLFIPLLSGKNCSCNLDSKGQPIVPLDTSDWDPKGSDTDCSGASSRNPKCPTATTTRSVAASPSTTTPACKNTSGCITDTGACAQTMNSQCSAWCDSKILLTAPGQSISCVDVSIMDVLGNLLQNALPFDFKSIEKILFWAAVGIVGLLVLGFLWKEVAYITEGGGGYGSHTIYVKTEPPSTTVSFGRRKKRYT